MSWLSVNAFKTITGVKIDDAIVQEAIESSERIIVKKLFITKLYDYQQSTTQHQLLHPIADQNADSVVDKNDVDAWEEDASYNEYDLNANLISVENRRQRSFATFDVSVPTSGRKLYIDYKIARQDIEYMLNELTELQKLLTVDYLFTNIPFSKLQRGISTWTINGVNVAFDLSIMTQVKEQNKKRETELFDQLRAVRADGIAIGKGFHDYLDRRTHGIVFR